MKKQTKVDRYLRHVERELGGQSPVARAAIMVEVREQLDRALKRQPTADEALREMGPAKLTARSYLKASDRVASEPRPRWRRYLAFGTVAFFAAVFAAGLRFILKTTSADLNRKPTALAITVPPTGRIDQSGAPGQIVQQTPAVIEPESQSGTADLSASRVTKVRIPFNTGKIELNSSPGHDLTWTCLTNHRQEPKVDVDAGVLTLALDSLNVARCVIGVPADARVEVRGGNGHLEIKRPGSPLDVQLANGRVSVRPDPQRTYDFDVRVKNGLQDFFRRSSNPHAIKVKVNVTNGTVKNE